MNLSSNPYWQCLAAPWWQRKNEKSYVGLIVIVVLISLVGLAFAMRGDFERKSVLIGVSISAGVWMAAAWALQIAGLLVYNHPVQVRLVPNYLKVQRRTLIAVWAVYVAVQSPLVWLSLSSLGPETLALELCSPFFALVVSAAFATALAAQVRWPFLFFAAWVGSVVLVQWVIPVVGLNTAILKLLISNSSIVGAILMAAMAWLLTCGILRNGSESHRNAYHQRAEIRHLMMQDPKAKTSSILMPGGKTGKWLSVFSYPYERYLQRQLSHAKNSAGSVMRRLELAIFGNRHWIKQLTEGLGSIVGVGTVLALADKVWGANMWAAFSSGLFVWLVLGAAFALPMEMRNALLRSQREHGLLVLLPGVPCGVALNHAIAKNSLARLCMVWIALAIILVVVPSKSAASTVGWLHWAAVLPALPFALQDWSRLKTLATGPSIWVVARYFVGVPVAFLLHYYLEVELAWVVLTSVIAFVGHTGWRWRKLSIYPQALPAGRLAV